jgi:hypothetical protein
VALCEVKVMFELVLRLQVLEGLDAVLDVGGVYDPSRDRYDHHQKGFDEVFGHGFSTKLSSAGLVYKVILCFNSGYYVGIESVLRFGLILLVLMI